MRGSASEIDPIEEGWRMRIRSACLLYVSGALAVCLAWLGCGEDNPDTTPWAVYRLNGLVVEKTSGEAIGGVIVQFGTAFPDTTGGDGRWEIISDWLPFCQSPYIDPCELRFYFGMGVSVLDTVIYPDFVQVGQGDGSFKGEFHLLDHELVLDVE